MEDLSPERRLAVAIASAAADKKALDIVIMDVEGILSYTDYLVLCSGRSDRQVAAIADGVARAVRDEDNTRRPLGVEGSRGGWWVLMDFGDVVLRANPDGSASRECAGARHSLRLSSDQSDRFDTVR